jgi:hypothetical protein
MRFPVRGMATSTLDAYSGEDWSGADGFGDPGIHAVALAWKAGKGRALVVDPDALDAVLDGLTDLSNSEDEIAEEERKTAKYGRDPERMRHARQASDGLSAVSTRIARAFR